MLLHTILGSVSSESFVHKTKLEIVLLTVVLLLVRCRKNLAMCLATLPALCLLLASVSRSGQHERDTNKVAPLNKCFSP
jgi:hypothetical protein